MPDYDALAAKFNGGAAARAAAGATAGPDKYDQLAAKFQNDPTSGNSFLENALIGVGKGMTDLALGAKQRFDDAAAALERKFGGQSINAALGMRNAADIQRDTQQAVNEKRVTDAPIMRTAGGKVGETAAKVIPAIGAAFVPGGQGLAGSMIAGAAMGAVDPTTEDESALKNAAFGALGGAAGYGVGKLVGKGVSALAARSQAKAAENSLVDANTLAAREAGYVIPPSQSNPGSLTANTLDILAGGRPKMAQAASIKNQGTTNALAAKALGLPEGQPLTLDALNQVRAAAYNQGYAPIAAAGKVTPGPAYTQALDDIVATTKGAGNSFPGAVKNDIPALVDGLRVPEFEAGDALKMVQVLRNQADTAYRAGDKMLGKANRQAASALEDALDSHLQASGMTDALQAFREARTQIAKTFTVEKALNTETGNVSARVLGRELGKGKPLTDELLSIGKMARLSPKNIQDMAYATPGASQLEAVAAAGAAVDRGSLLPLGIPYLRAGARDVLLSQPLQRNMPAPGYGLFQNVNPQLPAKLPGLLGLGGASVGPGLLNFGQQ